MRFLLAFSIILLTGQSLKGQTILSGTIKNTKDEALSRINLLVYLPNTKVLIAFAVSDDKGYFETIVNSNSDSLDIELSSIHYRNENHHISNTSQNLQFELETDVTQLGTFTVQASPIDQRGDTITYLVSSFARKEDRAIEDVLRRMPGIEVEPNGQILYQGVPLQKFYVEGLDLMDGRYAVVSKNLPHGAVGTVEILENHQPVRILEDRVTSHQASINLKLKRNITTTGTAQLGAGIYPFLWDVNVTPMIFTKNFQVVASYQTNNTGNDVSQQLKVLTFQELIQNADRPAENPNLTNIQAVSPPKIDQDRYLDNNIHLLNFNGLLRLNSDFQLRTNLYYVHDIQQQQSALKRTLYNPSDTLVFSEIYDNKPQGEYLHGIFTLSRNVKKNYLNNKLIIRSRWDKHAGLVFTENNEVIKQSLNDPLQAISNEFRSVNPIGKHLVEFRSFISYNDIANSLAVSPGQFEGVLNDSVSYNNTLQQISLKRFYTDNSASFTFGWKRLSIKPRLGIAYRQQLLESNILITEQEEENESGSKFINHLDGRNTRTYFQTNIEYRMSKLSVKVKLPLSWQQVLLNDSFLEKSQHINRFLFNPVLSANYKINGYWRIRGYWSYTTKLGDIDRVHYGFVLKNYRNLSQNAAPLSETSRQNFSMHLSFRNPITSFFNSINYVYSISNTNLIYSSIVLPDGTAILQAFEIPNTSWSHNFQARTSKYFAVAKSTISIRLSYSQRNGKSLLNGELFNSKNVFYYVVPELNVRISRWMNSEYSLNASFIETYIEKDKKSNISLFRHHLNIFAFPVKNQLISLSSEYYNHEGNNNFFVDLLYRYTFTKRKIDIEFRWNNILNNKTYTTFQASAFTVWESSYILRPAQLLLLVKFSFL